MEPSNARECCICYGVYDNGECLPKIMACGHVACARCLQRNISVENLPTSRYISDRSVICPICRKIYNGSVSSLVTVYALIHETVSSSTSSSVLLCCAKCNKTRRMVTVYCESCKQNLCKIHAINHGDEFEDHTVVAVTSSYSVMSPELEAEIMKKLDLLISYDTLAQTIETNLRYPSIITMCLDRLETVTENKVPYVLIRDIKSAVEAHPGNRYMTIQCLEALLLLANSTDDRRQFRDVMHFPSALLEDHENDAEIVVKVLAVAEALHSYDSIVCDTLMRCLSTHLSNSDACASIFTAVIRMTDHGGENDHIFQAIYIDLKRILSTHMDNEQVVSCVFEALICLQVHDDEFGVKFEDASSLITSLLLKYITNRPISEKLSLVVCNLSVDANQYSNTLRNLIHICPIVSDLLNQHWEDIYIRSNLFGIISGLCGNFENRRSLRSFCPMLTKLFLLCETNEEDLPYDIFWIIYNICLDKSACREMSGIFPLLVRIVLNPKAFPKYETDRVLMILESVLMHDFAMEEMMCIVPGLTSLLADNLMDNDMTRRVCKIISVNCKGSHEYRELFRPACVSLIGALSCQVAEHDEVSFVILEAISDLANENPGNMKKFIGLCPMLPILAMKYDRQPGYSPCIGRIVETLSYDIECWQMMNIVGLRVSLTNLNIGSSDGVFSSAIDSLRCNRY